MLPITLSIMAIGCRSTPKLYKTMGAWQDQDDTTTIVVLARLIPNSLILISQNIDEIGTHNLPIFIKQNNEIDVKLTQIKKSTNYAKANWSPFSRSFNNATSTLMTEK